MEIIGYAATALAAIGFVLDKIPTVSTKLRRALLSFNDVRDALETLRHRGEPATASAATPAATDPQESTSTRHVGGPSR